jgi:hypothetical protein
MLLSSSPVEVAQNQINMNSYRKIKVNFLFQCAKLTKFHVRHHGNCKACVGTTSVDYAA